MLNKDRLVNLANNFHNSFYNNNKCKGVQKTNDMIHMYNADSGIYNKTYGNHPRHAFGIGPRMQAYLVRS